MDLRDIRRTRLRQLIRERFGNVSARLAEVMEWPPTDVSRFFTKGPHGRHLSEIKARAVEKKCKLDKYWLDQEEAPHLNVQQSLGAYSIPEPVQTKLLDAYSFLTPEQQDDILDQMHAYRKANEAAVKHLSGRFKTVTKARAAEKLPVAPGQNK